MAGEAGFDLAEYPAVRDWIERVEATPGHVNDLEPIPPNARLAPVAASTADSPALGG